MTAPAALADAQRRRAARLAGTVARRLQERWRQLDPGALDSSWTRLLPGSAQLLAAAQVLAAAQAAEYVAAATGVAGAADIVPAGFAGAAADGRSLLTLLQLPLIVTKQAIGAGQPPQEALGRGLAQLTMIGSTEVADAGRLATGAAITARRSVYGHVRVVNTPACGRCIVLAGRVYRWSQGFDRHPKCKCGMQLVGSPEARAARTPEQLFAAMDSSEQERAFTVAGARAIQDGADIGQVVNAKRGIYEAGGRSFTTEATTRRGLAGKRLEAAGAAIERRQGERYRRVKVPRLTPKQIYLEAVEDRAEAVRLLRRFGYLS